MKIKLATVAMLAAVAAVAHEGTGDHEHEGVVADEVEVRVDETLEGGITSVEDASPEDAAGESAADENVHDEDTAETADTAGSGASKGV